MQHAARALVIALIAGLLAAVPATATTTVAGPGVGPTVPAAATLSTAKVVIIVGATHSDTSHYRDIADSAYAEAIKWSSNVVKVYSPYATWSAVSSAVQGASVIVYLGHGNGWPSPYTYDPNYTTKDGFGLNASAGNGDYNNTYYGEPYIRQLAFAPNAVVLLNHLCYASGNSEPGYANPTLSVAMQRVDNYGAAFLRAGARAVVAEGHGSINGMIRDLFTSHQTILDLWRGQYDYHGNELSFSSSRSPGYSAFMDPDNPGSGFYRSLVGNPDLRTDDVTGVPYVPTDTTPATLQSPGAASAGDGGADLFGDSSLSSSRGHLTAGTAVRVQSLVDTTSAGSPTAAYVRTLDGTSEGWTSALALVPQDSAGPELWGVSGLRTISPNGDGTNDTLDLTLQFSEDVAWTAHVQVGSNTVWQAGGSGRQAAISWDALVGGSPLAQGTYALLIHAADAWGNPELDTETTFTIDNSIMPVRLGGADRYATAAAISAATYAPGVPVAYIASGRGFADALAGAPAAGMAGGPLLLVPNTWIPPVIAAELTRLQPAKIIVLGGPASVSDDVIVQLDSYTNGPIYRFGGLDRYETAAVISANTYAPGVPVAYVASGRGFADALAGAPAAGTFGGPLLLVPNTWIPPVVAAELTRLKPAKIIVLGGPASVSDDVVVQLDSYTDGLIYRFGGLDRYGTAAVISANTYAPGVPVAYVASGRGFADALAGAPAAGTAGGPLLLIPNTSIPSVIAAELDRLNPAKIIVLGGPASVSDAVLLQLKGYTGS